MWLEVTLEKSLLYKIIDLGNSNIIITHLIYHFGGETNCLLTKYSLFKTMVSVLIYLLATRNVHQDCYFAGNRHGGHTAPSLEQK